MVNLVSADVAMCLAMCLFMIQPEPPSTFTFKLPERGHKLFRRNFRWLYEEFSDVHDSSDLVDWRSLVIKDDILTSENKFSLIPQNDLES